MNNRLIVVRNWSPLKVFFMALPCLLVAPSCSRIKAEQSYENRLIAENLSIGTENAPGGLTLNLVLSPGREYVFELRGKLLNNIPTLRIDSGGSQPEYLRYINPLESGVYFKVRANGRLRLMIYQDTPFSYNLISLRMTAVSPGGKSTAPDIFDEHISPEKYVIPFPAKSSSP